MSRSTLAESRVARLLPASKIGTLMLGAKVQAPLPDLNRPANAELDEKAILRRGPQLLASSAPRLLIDEAQYRASIDGIALDLPPLELRLLSTFARSAGRVFSRDQLLDKIYSDHRVVTDRTVDSHIRNLRRKLEQACPGETPIESLYGVGYRFQLSEA